MTTGCSNGSVIADRIAIGGLVAVLALVLTASATWIASHEQPIHADEALYLRELHRDVSFYEASGPWRLLKAWFFEDVYRPPAYRVFAFVPALIFGVTPSVARASNVALLLIATAVLFQMIRQRLDTRAAVVVTAILLSTPGVIVNASWYGTEATSYLVLTCTLFFLLRDLDSPHLRLGTVVGLGISLGVGCLTKTSFAPPAAAAVVAFLVVRVMGGSARRTVRDLTVAFFIALLIALPWWLYNVRPALSFAAWASGDTAYKLGGSGMSSFGAWLHALVVFGSGVVQLLCVAVLIDWSRLPPTPHATVAAVALSAAIPLPVLAFLSGNHEPRLISAAFFPASVALAAFMNRRPLVRSAVMVLLLTASALLYAPHVPPHPMQLGVAFQRWDQFDWAPLKRMIDERQSQPRRIVTLVQTPAINASQIAYAWRGSNEPAWATDAALPRDSASLERAVDAADVVIIATAAPGAIPRISPPFPALQPIREGLQRSRWLVAVVSRMNGFEVPPTVLRGSRGSTVAVFFRRHGALKRTP